MTLEQPATQVKKKMLALDGGGIRGVFTLGVLEAMETLAGKPLGEYFDYIGGTSTGAIIAAGLAKGMTVAQLVEFYKNVGPMMFEPRSLLRRYKSLYTSDPLKAQLQQVFEPNTRLGDMQKPLLLIVTRNWTTDSPWPISSNPGAHYNERTRPDCNLLIPLWQLVRASTAAPVYFPPEVLNWDQHDASKSFVFVDGGVTPYNNPAFLMFRMATLPQYRLNWATGEKNLLLISVGTGGAPQAGAEVDSPEGAIPTLIPGLISALMYGASVDQDINCRTVGRCMYGDVIDRELGDMVSGEPLDKDTGKAFRYARYNCELTDAWMDKAGIKQYDLATLKKMDSATSDNISNLFELGQKVGASVKKEHFSWFV